MERHRTTGEGRDNDNNTNNPNNPAAARAAARSQPGVPALRGAEAGGRGAAPTSRQSFSPRPGSAGRSHRQRPRGGAGSAGRGEEPELRQPLARSHRLRGGLFAPPRQPALLRPHGAARVKSEDDKKGARKRASAPAGEKEVEAGGSAPSPASPPRAAGHRRLSSAPAGGEGASPLPATPGSPALPALPAAAELSKPARGQKPPGSPRRPPPPLRGGGRARPAQPRGAGGSPAPPP